MQFSACPAMLSLQYSGTMDEEIKQPCFFDDGLRFQCNSCGACCTGGPGTVYVGEKEIDELAGALGITRDAFIAGYLYPFRDGYSIRERANYDCFLLKDGKCTAYASRPRQCRTFPFWFRNLRSQSDWNREARRCPGIDKGRLYTKNEILEIISGE